MDNRFRFDLPKGWQDQTVYYFIGPEIDGTGHQMILTLDRNLQQDEIGSFARKKTGPIVSSLGGLEVMKDEEVTLEGGNPAYEFVCKWVPSDQMTVIKMFVFVFFDDIGRK